MPTWRQVRTDGGHEIHMEAEVADGHLRIRDTWQDVYVESDDELVGAEVVGSTLTLREAWINGHPVLDPAYAQQLWREAVTH